VRGSFQSYEVDASYDAFVAEVEGAGAGARA
jgi:hypothetical protein